MLEASDVEFVRNLIIVIYLGLTIVASIVAAVFITLIVIKVSAIMDAAREAMKGVRGE